MLTKFNCLVALPSLLDICKDNLAKLLHVYLAIDVGCLGNEHGSMVLASCLQIGHSYSPAFT